MGFCLTAIRIWQWSSAFFAYASFSFLYDHIQKNHLGENGRMRGVQVLVCLVFLIYPQAIIVMILYLLDLLRPVGPRVTRLLDARRVLCACLQDSRSSNMAYLCHHVCAR